MKPLRSYLGLAAVVAAFCLLAWAARGPTASSKPLAAGASSGAVPQAVGRRAESLPAAAEAQRALDRALEGTVVLERSFVTGDFNGDDAIDLIAVVLPRPEALSRINAELASWFVHDASWTGRPREVPPVARIDGVEPVLAVVHGHGSEGFRSAEARQAYLLIHAAGTHLRSMPLDAALGRVGLSGALLRPGHVLAQVREGRSGFLVWNGWRYVWYVPSS